MPDDIETAAIAESSPQSPGAQPLVTTRRVVLCGAGGAAALALAGCSSSGSTASGSSAASAGTMTSGAGTGADPGSGMASGAGPGAGSSSSADAGSGSGAGTVLGKAADVPVGGGTVFAAAKVVVTQSTAGQYKGFSAVCTHRGCTVSQVADGVIICPCHGSQFRAEDGSVAKGPATSALAPVPVKVQNGTLVAGA
ncbi:Rieske (2Fe-2S) protein [Kitasatospora sp. NBC_01302]|uniref:Rieske (2Fe-2S) protein n=1 Tax=Kitasatospora sp. NBC_01302 TaxID=2903575 RepID=UPI002E11D8FC|nr:Rieske (2Fe-2S) protein [Kitasatospora sp. NBC_01302]